MYLSTSATVPTTQWPEHRSLEKDLDTAGGDTSDVVST